MFGSTISGQKLKHISIDRTYSEFIGRFHYNVAGDGEAAVIRVKNSLFVEFEDKYINRCTS
jgi:hypothetical protein